MRQPDDWHLHLRDGDILNAVVPPTAKVFRRAVVMPNLQPPITSLQAAIDYKQRIMNAIPTEVAFTPLMTVYLTDDISSEVLREGHKEGVLMAAKLYPANSTTNSSGGVTDIKNIYSIFETMEEIGLPLLIHGEVTDQDVDIFDRESVFIERYLDPLLTKFPDIRTVLEHITTDDAVQYVQASNAKLAATITPHHLHINRNAIFQDGLRSDFFCLPVAKRERHRIALRRAAISGEPCFFLGTDSAPHLRESKESACGCAGIFNAINAIESYAQVFDEEGAIERLEAFASEFGPAFYKLPLNENSITLVKKAIKIPSRFELNNADDLSNYIVPFHAGETLNWSFESIQPFSQKV
ncbi:Dihydroorotase [Prochlorococcus marinus str. SS2]|nr:Dihydroorotase [Prochlorococcus marinus str. SS2]KGG23203.1 Dihydroorotase [Prochlorococcus marinus str. SS35]